MKKLIFLAVLIAPFVTRAQNGFIRNAKGVQYKVVSHPTAEHIKMEDVVTFNVVQKTEKDSVLFSSYVLGHPIKIQVKPSESIGDLMDIFPLLCNKDSVVVKVPTDSIFVGHEEARPPFLAKNSNIIFTLKIERVQSLNDAIAERNALMDKMRADETNAANKYIEDHKLQLKSTASGLKYVITRATVNKKVLSGDTLLVNYIGRTTEGKVFDSSIESAAREAGLQQPGREYAPLKVVVGQGQVIKGWDEGLQLLTQGSKAILVIPSKLAYGDQGAGDDIKPFSTLIFNIEVVKVTHPKPAATKAGTKTTAKKTTTGAKSKTGAKAPAKKPAAAPKKN